MPAQKPKKPVQAVAKTKTAAKAAPAKAKPVAKAAAKPAAKPAAAKPRKKLPKELAVIFADNCTGCESCLEVCPVDCIIKIQQYDQFHNLQSWCQIDPERCVGCEVCVHIPQKKTNPYELTVCPWDAIEMVPTEKVALAVAAMGGPPEYVEANWDRLVGTAQHLAELKANS